MSVTMYIDGDIDGDFIQMANSTFRELLQMLELPEGYGLCGVVEGGLLKLAQQKALLALNNDRRREHYCYATTIDESPGKATFIVCGRDDAYWKSRLHQFLVLARTATERGKGLVYG